MNFSRRVSGISGTSDTSQNLNFSRIVSGISGTSDTGELLDYFQKSLMKLVSEVPEIPETLLKKFKFSLVSEVPEMLDIFQKNPTPK